MKIVEIIKITFVIIFLYCLYGFNQYLLHSNLKYAAWRQNDLSGYNFQEIGVRRGDFDTHVFSHCNFKKAEVIDSSLRMTRFNGANMTEANFDNSDFYKADLSFVHAHKANFKYAILWGTYCAHADFRQANLMRSTLFSTDLSTANLKGANLQLAWYSSKTKWPKGFDPKKAGAVFFADPGRNYKRNYNGMR
jgi:uncharacterized protein YjbI with pentapeptide repeats